MITQILASGGGGGGGLTVLILIAIIAYFIPTIVAALDIYRVGGGRGHGCESLSLSTVGASAR